MKRQRWAADHDHVFIRSLGDDLPFIREQVQSNAAQLWRFDSPMFHLVTRVEKNARGLELVLVAAEGRGLAKHWQTLEQQMEPESFTSYRLHTTRAGIVRLMTRRGFEVGGQESGNHVLYRDLSNG